MPSFRGTSSNTHCTSQSWPSRVDPAFACLPSALIACEAGLTPQLGLPGSMKNIFRYARHPPGHQAKAGKVINVEQRQSLGCLNYIQAEDIQSEELAHL